MSRVLPLGNVPDSNVFPDGIFRLKVVKFEEGQTKEAEGKTQKLQFRLQCQIVEPKQFAGLMYFEQFTIGTEEDPDAELLETWQTSFGARGLKKFVKKTGVPIGDEEDSEVLCNAVKDAELLATIVQKIEPDRKKINGVEQDNPYKGTVRNNCTAWWALGEKEAALTNGAAGKPEPATTAKRPRAAAPKAPEGKPAPTDDVTCVSCRKRVPRKELKAHTDQHLAEMLAEGGGE